MWLSAIAAARGARAVPLVPRLVREPERRSHDDHLAGELDPDDPLA
jgi:hypothetical protein